jgi:hypothetical protein
LPRQEGSEFNTRDGNTQSRSVSGQHGFFPMVSMFRPRLAMETDLLKQAREDLRGWVMHARSAGGDLAVDVVPAVVLLGGVAVVGAAA